MVIYMNHKRVSVIIPAAGNATRMNGIHKTMYRLAGVPVLIRTLKAFQNIDCVGEIIAAVKHLQRQTHGLILLQFTMGQDR